MAKATPIIAAFNAGEWSPLLDGRIDLQGYTASAKQLTNWLPLVQGPVIKRAGTRHINSTKTPADRVWLVPFVRSRTISYVIEFGDAYCRFYFGRAQVVSSGSPYEIVSPYSLANLTGANGEFMLDVVQSGDVLYITHRGGMYAPRKLSRTSSTSWAFSTLEPDNGPFLDLNSTSTTAYASAASGTGITITASSSIFTAGHVGALFKIEQQIITSTQPWKASTSYTAGDFVRSQGKEYVAATTGTSGTTIPAHTTGTVSDGGVDWTYTSPGYGVARITAQSGTTATADVIVTFPQTIVGSGNASELWRFGAWSESNGYPEVVTFFKERLVFAAKQRIYLSVSAAFEDFSPDTFGEVLADNAVNLTIQSSEVNDVVGLVEGSVLAIHTEGAEFVLQPLTNSEPLGPGNVEIVRATTYGSRAVRPIRVGEAVLFVQSSGRKVREMIYDIQVDALVARDLTVRSEHLMRPSIIGFVRQREPYAILWAWLADGTLLSLTYDRTQEVRGWSPMQLGGNGVVESCAVIPSPDGTRDDLWLIVKRTINGSTVRHVEYMRPEHQPGDLLEDSVYVDNSLTYDGAAATTISGLSHLEGETVRVLADGSTHPDKVVSSGQITLDRSASVVHIGLPYSANYQSFRIEAGASEGTSQSKTKRITDVAFRVDNTLGGQAGPDLLSLDDIPDLMFRSPATSMGSAPGLFSGDALVSWPGGYETDGRICFKHDNAYPATLVAVVPQVVTQEAR